MKRNAIIHEMVQKNKQLKHPKVTEIIRKDKAELWPTGEKDKPLHPSLEDFYKRRKGK
jgi:Txe/YoeB family toxin of Txe-Axe toxin-antitoxin module